MQQKNVYRKDERGIDTLEIRMYNIIGSKQKNLCLTKISIQKRRMFMFKKTICGALSVLLCASAVTAAPCAYAAEVGQENAAAASAADFNSENNISLKVWVPDSAVSLVKTQVEKFKSLYSSKKFRSIEVTACSEVEAAVNVINDTSGSADVFFTSCDMINRLADESCIKEAGFLSEVRSRDEANALQSASYNGKLYGYPVTCDNGYYLVYDKSVVTAESAKSLEDTLAACRSKGKKFYYDYTNGFYSCAFAFTAGVKINGYESDGYTQRFKKYSEAEAVETLQRFSSLMKTYKGTFVSAEASEIAVGFTTGTVGAAVDGVWNRSADEDALGGNYGAAVLPTVTVDGVKKQMVPIQGFKSICVNAAAYYSASAQMLANYLSGEACQKEYAQEFGWAPTNKAVQNSSAAADDPLMKVMVEQSKYACPQTCVSPTFWTPMGVLGEKIANCSDPADDSYFKKLIAETVAEIREEEEGEDIPVITGFRSTEDGIVINWQGVQDAYAYRVFYRGSSGWRRLGDTTSTSLVDTVVSFGKTYNYTVRCIDRYGNYTSGYYEPGWDGTYAADEPMITALRSNADGITIRWRPVTGVSTYRVYYRNASGEWRSFRNDVKGTSMVDSGVAYGREETYTIRALDKDGRVISGYDHEGWSTTYGIETPSITALTSDENGITIRWNAVDGAAKYRVYYKNASGEWRSFSQDVADTSMIDRAVRYGRSETYTVRAVNNKGNVMSGYVAAGRSTVYGVATPNIASLKNTANGIKITWNKIPGVSTYRVYYKNASGEWRSFKTDVNGTTMTDTAVKQGRSETYTVRALDRYGNTISDYNHSGSTIVYRKP